MALSEKKKASNSRWDAANLKRLSVGMLIRDFEAMEKHIAERHEKRNHFINRAIANTIKTDKLEEDNKDE